MDSKNITLKDIAKEAGTSVTTVYRVLNNKEGVGDELRQKILKISKELGYTLNYAASSLSKKATNIVVFFPKKDETSRFYTNLIYEGYVKFKEEISGFNITFTEYFYEYEHENLSILLERLFNDKSFKVDGLLIYPMRSRQIINLLNRFAGRGIPIVLIDKDLTEVARLTCVKPNDELAGRLSGELMSKLVHKSGKILIADNDITVLDTDISVHDANSNGFVQMLQSRRNDLTTERIQISYKDNQLYHFMKDRLESDANIVGVYSTTARNTVSVAKAVFHLNLQKKITFIGSEVFDENIRMLENGVIDAIIYKNPFLIGYEALKILFNHVLKGQEAKKQYNITPRIILESNVTVLADSY
ncbi:MAG: LacI family transcriptional regulator [Clostridiales bacterium]|nr:LacI family transcriptional regulator [Clostridiales bacterium]